MAGFNIFRDLRTRGHRGRGGVKISVLPLTLLVIVTTVLPLPLNWRRQISTLYKIKTPERIEMKFCTVNYIHELCPGTKFGDDQSVDPKPNYQTPHRLA